MGTWRLLACGLMVGALCQTPAIAQQVRILSGNQLVALPGYQLVPGPGNKVTARRLGGGRAGFTYSCICSGGDGSCTGSIAGDVAVCSKSPGRPCHGSCRWRIDQLGAPSGVVQ